ncbi:MAG: ComF family protein [Dorea sp.]|jgi:ComF family protein|nr:ComF family protein [Dorea sp.]
MRWNRRTKERKTEGGLLRLLYPHVCPFCGRVTAEDICNECREKLYYIEEPRCMRCSKPIRSEEQEYCYDCERHTRVYERGYALWVHKGDVQRAIYQFKYHNRRIYSRFFGKELLSRYGQAVKKWDITTIIPIPLSRKRRRIRGFNQAELLARELGRGLGIPVDAKNLVRVRDTRPQKKMDAKERSLNLKRAFAWRGKGRIFGNILLIDDIYTTGSTIDAAARVLKENGAGKIYFLTISIGQGY